MQRLTTRARPLGITIISIIMAIEGILGIIGGIVMISSGTYSTLGITTLVLAVINLILAWGLWTVQTWAYWGTVILEILVIINGIFGLGRGVPSTGILSLIFAIVVLIYMFADRNVRAAFRT